MSCKINGIQSTVIAKIVVSFEGLLTSQERNFFLLHGKSLPILEKFQENNLILSALALKKQTVGIS